MKLKDIAKLCAKTHSIGISEVNGTQWLGNGHAYYPVYGLPKLDTDTVAAVLDFSEEKQKQISTLRLKLDDYYDLSDTVNGELLLTNAVLRFLHGGRTVDAWTTEGGRIAFIDAALTKPYLADDCEAQLYLRRTDGGQTYIVGKSGMFISAIMAPFRFEQGKAAELEGRFSALAAEMQSIVLRTCGITAVDPDTGEARDDEYR